MRQLLTAFPLSISLGRPSRAELLALVGGALLLASAASALAW